MFGNGPSKILISVVLFSIHAFTQQSAPLKITVGDPIVNGARLQPYQNQWSMTMVKPDGDVVQDAGNWKDELEAVEINGKPALQRTQMATFKKRNGEVGATTRTINIFDRKTLAPLSRAYEKHIRGGSDSSLSIKFGADSMKLENTENGKSEVKELPTTAAYDFYGGIYAVLWAAMPLSHRFSVTYPSYGENEHPEKFSWVTATVTRSETVDAGTKGRVKAWVIESDTDIGKLKYWVSRKSPYIIRMDYTQKDGTIWMLKMI